MSSTIAPSLTTTTGSAASPTSSCAINQAYILPISDAACGVPNTSDDYKDLMSSCCGSADVVGFDQGCGLYCLAVDQTIEDLQDCLFDSGKGVAYQSVYCSGKQNATATDPGASLPSGATVVVDNGGGSGDDDDDGDDDGDDSDGGNGDDDDQGGSAARAGISKMGLTVAGLLFSVTALGAFQL